MKKKTFLVTGAAGFIGFNFSKKLLNEGHKVYGIDNFDKYYSIKLKYKRARYLKKYKNFIFLKINIEEMDKLKKINIKKIDHVFHFAAQAGVRYSAINPIKYINTNILGTINVLKFIRDKKPKSTFFASSSSVYGDSKKFPLKENDNLKPKNIYATSKMINELSARSFSKNFNLNIYGLRFFTIYGDWGRPDMLLYKIFKSTMEKKYIELNNKGNHIRDFTYIDDVTNILYNLVFKKIKKKYDIFNICSNKPIHIGKMIKEIQNQNINLKVKMINKNKLDVFKTHGDNSKILKLLKNFKFTKFNDVFKDSYKWYLKNNKNLIF